MTGSLVVKGMGLAKPFLGGLSLSVHAMGTEACSLPLAHDYPELLRAGQSKPALAVPGVCICSVGAGGSWKGN